MQSLVPLSALPDAREALFFRLSGGLGNLLFQYMAGQAASERLHVPVHYVPDVPMIHGSGLERLEIEASYVEVPADLLRRVDRKKDRTATEHLKSALGLWPLTPVREPHFHFWEEFEHIESGSLVFGYWQSPLYFGHLQSKLASLLRRRQLEKAGLEGIADVLAQPGSVGVHVRRNDYATSPQTLQVHGLMEKAYYDRARSTIENTAQAQRFFVFSDDPDAAEELLGHWPNTDFMPMREQEIDMILLSLCNHFIIANSTFSWWPAFLSTASNKRVVAPRHWFSRTTMLQRYTLDLLPESWIQVAG